MKKAFALMIIVNILFFATACSDSISNVNGNEDAEESGDYHAVINNTLKFSYNDLIVDNIHYGMTEQQVINLIGEPNRIDDDDGQDSQDTRGRVIAYYYNELGVWFCSHDGQMLVSSISSESDKFVFARGLKVGDTKEKVISAFYREQELMCVVSPRDNQVFGKYLYGHYTSDDFEERQITGKVEYAFINNYRFDEKDTDSTYMIGYYYLEPPYVNRYASLLEVNGALIFDMNTEDVVTQIRWYYNPCEL